MGLMDSFTSDAPVELKYREYYNLMREAAKTELIENAIKADVPGYYIAAMLTGKLEMPVYDAELNTEVQIEETTEEWGSMVSAIRGIFDKRTTERQIKETSGHILALICEFEQMRKEELEKEKILCKQNTNISPEEIHKFLKNQKEPMAAIVGAWPGTDTAKGQQEADRKKARVNNGNERVKTRTCGSSQQRIEPGKR